jgi:protein-L-isoaspartate(D-aspartate) O-methyltransferase
MNIEQARFNMIEQQIRPWEVLDPTVLALLAAVRREDFVPAAYQGMAFMDTEVPLPSATSAQLQHMLAPKVEARLLQELDVRKHERVLEIGAGSGFMAALLGHRAQQVTTLEIDADLAALARRNLARAGVTNVSVQQADGAAPGPQVLAEGPFDVIVLSGSVAELPSALLDLLKPGGRLVGIVGQLPIMRARLVTRGSGAAFGSVDLFDTVAPRLRGFDEPSRFSF